jgi:PKD repeat protein
MKNNRNFIHKIIAVCTVLIVGLSSCNKDEIIKSVVIEGEKPVASFTNTSGSLTINFTGTATNGDSYYWQFGDGSFSTQQSPVHEYKVPGKYDVILKVKSKAGYASTITKNVVAASPAAADFDIAATSFGLNTVFVNSSLAADAAVWDFGDGSPTSTSMAPTHKFPAYGNYTVKLKVTGLLGDVSEKVKTITVADNNLIKGGGFETGDGAFWNTHTNVVVPVFGYTEDKPAGGYDGCLRWPKFGGTNTSAGLIYQAVQVVAGKNYKFTAQVKVPAGAANSYLQFYISRSSTLWVENNSSPDNNFIYGLNTWNGWGANQNSKALDGEISQLSPANGNYGLLASKNGIYTATTTGTVYVGIGVLAQVTSGGDFLVDNISLVPVP